MADLLIQKGIDVNRKNGFDETPLYWAVRNGKFLALILHKMFSTQMILWILESSYFQNKIYSKKIIGNEKIVKLLINSGADVNIVMQFGDTAQHLATNHRSL